MKTGSILSNITGKKVLYACINLILIAISYLIMIFIENKYSPIDAIVILSNAGTVFFIGYFLIYYLISNHCFTPYTIFYTSFFIFQFGQCVLYGFGIEYQNYYIFNYGDDILIKSIKYTILCFGTLNMGAVLSHTKFSKKTKLIDLCQKGNIARISKLLFYLSCCIAFPLAFIKFIIGIQTGYFGVIAFESNVNFIIKFIEYFFVPLGCLFWIYTDSKQSKKIVTFLVFFWGILIMLSGDRTSGIAALIISCLFGDISAVFKNKFKKGNTKKIVVVFLLVFLCISVIKSFRLVDERNKLLNEDIGKVTSDVIVNSIGEMGFSMMPLIMTMNVIPHYEEYHFGKTYGAAILSVLPASIDPTGIVKKVFEKANLSEWLTNYYNFTFGLGYSLIAESYANFGLWGFLIFIFIGYFIGWILDLPSISLDNDSLFWKYVRLAMLFEFFTIPRRESYYIFKHSFYIILCIAILIIFFSSKKRKPIEHSCVIGG